MNYSSILKWLVISQENRFGWFINKLISVINYK